MAQFNGSQTFVVPVTLGEYAPERLTFGRASASLAPLSLLAATVLVTATVAAAVIEMWLLKSGGDPTNSAHWFNTAKSITATGAETWPLAGWDGVEFRVKSGGTAGNLTLSATAE